MEYPIVLLDAWILDLVTTSVRNRSIYSNPILVKNVITFDGPDSSNLITTPILRLFSFTKSTASGELTAVLNDASHKVLALFSRKCIQDFESRYAQRITYDTINSLFLVKRALLRFITLRELRHKFGVVNGLRVSSDVALVYLEVTDVEFFHREQAKVASLAENTLRFIYADENYKEKLGQTNANDEKLGRFAFEWQEGLVSDEEDIPSGALEQI